MRNKLREIRLSRNLTQEEVSELIGLQRTSYLRIESGERNPSLETAIKIKRALDYDDDDIFDITED